ncbi:sigma-54 interaction domain-containing protein [Sporosarcina newyorkensis]|uniref:PAS domain S-box-containing protein n=1 Tax=Sporosarcina newyorkensis TaxID=759851 RepID=A0A1T4Y8V6_9BACL|nr:sigma 54-interacting transcriptional regulator [Sporosarcina newyorkensis]SKA97938.1 PAS domain S-box-containing protein [Sporosarcina newyorkensis]
MEYKDSLKVGMIKYDDRLIAEGMGLLFETAPIGLVVLDDKGCVKSLNLYAREKFKSAAISEGSYIMDYIETVPASETFKMIRCNIDGETLIGKIEKYENGDYLLLQTEEELDQLLLGIDTYRNLLLDFKAIFDHSYDVIYVSDGQGQTLRVSAASERLWGYKESELVGKTVYQLEAEGVFTPSVTREVLEREEKVSLVQTTKMGRRLLVVGTPIKDSNGNILRVVNASRDVTELKELKGEIDLLKQMMEGYRQEIEQLRENEALERRFIARSAGMRQVIQFAQRVAKADSPILLLGESGVGKEGIATLIHKWSNRSSGPLLVTSCETVSAEMLEKELLGAEDRLGLIEMANSGTLFLEQVDKMPMSIQAKLVRALQRGILEEKKVDVRIIATASEDLKVKLEEGKFREDFYYYLNVVPIEVPSLRERREDIIPLIIHFLKELNELYKDDRKINPNVLKTLEKYDWPGNVQELRNITERLYVTSEGQEIGPEALPSSLDLINRNEQAVQVYEIMPLKSAVELVEQQLLELAGKKYASTTQIARALQIDQSTVSRKLKRYFKEE